MCLSTVTWKAKTKKNIKSQTKWLKGYKVYKTTTCIWDKEQNKYIDVTVIQSPHYPSSNAGPDYENLIPNTILKAVPYFDKEVDSIKASDDSLYPYGFHVFPVKMASFHYHNGTDGRQKLFEVMYRKVVAEGLHSIHTSYPADCVIARELKIIRQLTQEEVDELNNQSLKNEEIKRKANSRRKRR